MIEWTVDYTSKREAFGQTIADFQNTQFTLAALKTDSVVARVYNDKCIELFMQGRLDPVDAAMAKMFSSNLHCLTVDECLQLFGGCPTCAKWRQVAVRLPHRHWRQQNQ